MKNSFPYLEFLNIAKECRKNMILDTLEYNSPDLYDALYSSSSSKVYEIKMELYELKWIESYWKEIEKAIEKKEFSVKEKKELISMFSKWYENFVDAWNYTKFDTVVFEERRKILQALINVNNDWENNLKRIKVSFDKNIKLLNEKIKEFEEE